MTTRSRRCRLPGVEGTAGASGRRAAWRTLVALVAVVAGGESAGGTIGSALPPEPRERHADAIDTTFTGTDLPMRDDVDALLERVNLGFRPQQVWWSEGASGGGAADDGEASDDRGTVPGPTDRFLVATLRLDAAASATLAERLEATPGRSRRVDVEPWMAPGLRSLAEGGKLLVERHDAIRFVERPYTQGRIDRVSGTDFVVLRLGS